MKALLQEAPKACLNVPRLISMSSSLWNVQPATLYVLGQGCCSSGWTRSFSKSIVDVTIFIVEPGAREPWKATLKPWLWLASARISPVEGRSTTTEERSLAATCSSAAACRVWFRVVSTLPGVPLLSSSSVLSDSFAFSESLPRTTRSSTPAVPPAVLPYFSRSPSRTGAREGYLAAVSSPPSRSYALTGGVPDAPVTRVSPSLRSGWTMEACQSTTGSPSFLSRTTVSELPYAIAFLVPLYDTVPLTEKGTSAPVRAPSVRVTPVMCASLV